MALNKKEYFVVEFLPPKVDDERLNIVNDVAHSEGKSAQDIWDAAMAWDFNPDHCVIIDQQGKVVTNYTRDLSN